VRLETGGDPVDGGGSPRENPLEVLLVATRLGLTSFGGPVAHLGYYHHEYVERRRSVGPHVYAELVALAQALPGPASIQVGISIGLMRAGLLGALMAWIGFTLPSAVAMVAFAYGLEELGSVEDQAWLHGLKLAAVAVVAFAVWTMARTLAPDPKRAAMAIAGAALVLVSRTALSQLAIIAVAGLIGWRLFLSAGSRPEVELPARVGRNVAIGAWLCFAGLLAVLPIAAAATGLHAIDLIDAFYRTGSLVFGGGHVVLPLLEREVVAPGWVSEDDFLAGYGAAQAVPGPLFTFSAYLGAVMGPEPNGIPGAALALCALFLPSFLLVIGGLPLWSLLRRNPSFQAALRGVNASVVGLLLAALYGPVWTSSVNSVSDLGLAAAGLALLALARAPPLLVVAFTAAGAELVTML